jgi:hypothetical protein
MWKNSQRYLEHCLYFDFPVCILLWLKKIGAKTFRFALVLTSRWEQEEKTEEDQWKLSFWNAERTGEVGC